MLLWIYTAFRVVILIGLIAGWIGTLIPAFPAPTVMWAFTLIYGIVSGFGTRGAIFFGLITLLTLVSWYSDNILSLASAKRGGAHTSSMLIASIVGLISSLLITPLIGILLTLLSLFLLELYAKREAKAAWRSTKAMLIGWGWAIIARLGIGLVILALWIIWAWV